MTPATKHVAEALAASVDAAAELVYPQAPPAIADQTRHEIRAWALRRVAVHAAM